MRVRSLERFSRFCNSLNPNNHFSKIILFPSTIIESKSLDPCLRKSESFSVFKRNFLNLIQPSLNSGFNFHNIGGICHITKYNKSTI